MRAGESIGGWRLIRKLGSGGNAVVWEAEEEGQQHGAIKLLTRRDRERIGRFTREVETMRALSGRPGVLPLLDAELPDTERRPVAGWLVTPVADVSYDALKGAELRDVVQAIHEIAGTLADLHTEPGVAHRDLKPSNLFRWEDDWVLGDFGLVTGGEKDEALTAPGRIVGPANFMAYEMLRDPTTADPFLADVLSLAKTLWVLATDQRWPPPGHQEAGTFPIRQFRAHPRADLLDSLLDRATSLFPQDRPAMAELAAELRVWLEFDEDSADGFSLGDFGAQLRERAAPYYDAQRQEQTTGRANYYAYETLRDRLAPLFRELERTLPGVESNPNPAMELGILGVRETMGSPRSLGSHSEGVRIAQPGEDFPVVLRMGALLERLNDSTVLVSGMLFLGRENVLGGETWVSDQRIARAGSIEVLANIESLVRDFEERLPDYVERYAELALEG